MEERGRMGGAAERRPAFHDLLVGFRAAAQETQAELARELGVSTKAIKAYERPPTHPSARTPPADVFARLCAHLRATGVLPPADYAAFAAARVARRRRRRRVGGADAPPPASGTPPTRRIVPRRLTALVGRDDLVAAICALLREPDVALVTLTGMGGIGKTHLAMEVARRLADTAPDGVWWVDLAPVFGADAVAAAIAERLGAIEPLGQKPRDRLVARLAGREMLVVLDNFEHVLAAAPLVSDLLVHCPGLRVLVTSRAPLRLHGEQERAVPPLDPATAALLFTRRVRDVLPGFGRTAENGAAIDAICKRLDGLPLALELAARQMPRYGTAEALLAALAPALSRLGDGPSDAPPRQATMRAAIAWSYDLLDPNARRLFRRLSICRGGCTLSAARALARKQGALFEAASTGTTRADAGLPLRGNPSDDQWAPRCRLEAGSPSGDGQGVCNTPLQRNPAETTLAGEEGAADEAIRAHLDQGLIRRSGRPDDDARLTMFEVVREYGLDQLAVEGELAEARRRHAANYRAMAEDAEPLLFRSDQTRVAHRLDRDHDNMRAALEWAIEERDGETALRIVNALWRYWERRGYVAEARAWLDRALSVAGEAAPAVRATAAYTAARLATLQADSVAATYWHEDARARAVEIGDQTLLAYVLNSMGGLAHGQEDYGQAVRLHEEALALFAALDDAEGMGDAHYNLGLVRVLQWDAAEAEPHYEQAAVLFQEVGNIRGYGLAQFGLGITRTMAGDWDAALVAYHAALVVARRARDTDLLMYALYGVAAVIGLQGGGAQSAQIFGAADRLREEGGLILPASYRALAETVMNLVRSAMNEPEIFERSYQEGRGLSRTQVMALARRCAATKAQ